MLNETENVIYSWICWFWIGKGWRGVVLLLCLPVQLVDIFPIGIHDKLGKPFNTILDYLRSVDDIEMWTQYSGEAGEQTQTHERWGGVEGWLVSEVYTQIRGICHSGVCLLHSLLFLLNSCFPFLFSPSIQGNPLTPACSRTAKISTKNKIQFYIFYIQNK